MKTDTTNRSLLRIPAGVITIVSLLGIISYIFWLFSGRYTPEIDAIVSSAGLILLNLLTFAFGLYVVLDHEYARTLRWGWSMLTLGVLCFAIAEALWMFYEQVLGLDPFPSPADFFYGLYYPLTLVGVLIFTFVFVPRKERGLLWLDLGIVMTFMFMVLWYSFLAWPFFASDQTLYKILLLYYPMGDFIILAAIIVLIQRDLTNVARQILGFIALSMIFSILGDTMFAYFEIQESVYVRAYLNVMWLFACLAQMLAVVRLIASGPGMVNDPPIRYSYVGPMLRLALPYLAIIIGMGLLVVSFHTDPTPDARLFGLLYGSMVLVLLVLLRQYLVMRDNVRMAQSMRRIAWTDSLTGVYNRHFFNEMLPREMERAVRYKHKLSLLMLDIDGFKKYNDTYGHLKGDVVLRTLARVFSNQMRASDIVARFGGDEFVVILPETSRHTALIIADRIRKAVSSQSFENVSLSISVGVTSFHPGLTPEQMVDEADRDMYRRKNAARKSGGREVSTSPPSEAVGPSGEGLADGENENKPREGSGDQGNLSINEFVRSLRSGDRSGE